MVKTCIVDLFCGVGGLTKGLTNSGLDVVAGIDIDSYCKYAYEENNNALFVEEGIESVTSEQLNNLYPADTEIKILVGCAPCQPFSAHTSKYRKDREITEETDPKWFLLHHFKRLIIETSPHIVSMENVPDLCKKEIFQDFVKSLMEHGYSVKYEVVNCVNYGVPQNRRRLVLLASNLGEIEMIQPTHMKENHATVEQTIGMLEEINAGGQSEKDPLHRSANLSVTNLKRIKQSIPGGTWLDWDESLINKCHKKETGSSYSAVYGRMEKEKPSPTITTQFYVYGTGRFGHPSQDRALSLREGALLQTFPASYTFSKEADDVVFSKIAMMIGNAVPVKLGEAIGKSILLHIEGAEQ
jgi:DNA (cytosine-5)-methyltransferase 1